MEIVLVRMKIVKLELAVTKQLKKMLVTANLCYFCEIVDDIFMLQVSHKLILLYNFI